MVNLPRIDRPRLTGWPKLRLLSSVRERIIAGFGLLVIILAAGAAGSAWQSRQHRSDLAEMEQHTVAETLLRGVELDAVGALAVVQHYVITGNDAAIPFVQLNAASALDGLAKTRASMEAHGRDADVAKLDSIMAEAHLIIPAWEEIITLRQSGDVEAATATLAEGLPAFEDLRQQFEELVERERLAAEDLRSRANRTADLVFWLLVVSGAIGAGLALAVSAFTARSILRPLSSLESTALAVADGDLQAPATGPQELAHLGASLNQMTESLLDASKRRELEEERERAYAQLQQSEARFRTLAETAAAAIFIIQGTHIRYVNPAAEAITGYTPQDWPEMRFWEIAHPDHQELLRERGLARQRGEKVPSRYEVKLLTKKDEERWVDYTAAAIEFEGKPAVLGTACDITERKRMEEALRSSEARHRTLLENLPQKIFLKDRNSLYVSCNENYARDLNIRPDEIAGKTDYDFFPKELAEKYRADDRRVVDSGETEDIEEEYVQDGQRVYVHTVKTPVRDESGDAVGVLGIFRDITERKRAEEALRRLNEQLERDHQKIKVLNRSLEGKVKERTQQLRLANEELRERNRQLLDARAQAATDALTGLRNHRAFHERIREETRRAREAGSPVGLIMMDIDGFKRVNDSLGHQAGDQILRELALTLADEVGHADAYRYGGDEFAILLPAVDRRKTARVAERLRRAVETRVEGSDEKVTVSLGVASFPETASSAEELIYGADAAMYWAKSAGKNRVGDWRKLLTYRADGTVPWYAADRGVKAPDVVVALVAALAAKDPTTAGHTQRCSWYTARLAEELGLAQEERSIVRLASLLHDIGKIAVRDEVLFKPGPLNEEEWVQMKQHSTAALHVLGHIRSLTDVVPAILHHHEHFDGSGYPDGLAGEQIPIASRILLVTDSFDAMTTDRPYRKAMPVEAAIEELKRCSGSQFDPAVADAFLRVLSREGAQPLRDMAATRPRQWRSDVPAARSR